MTQITPSGYHIQIRITYGLEKPIREDVKDQVRPLRDLPYIEDIIGGLEIGSAGGQWHFQGYIVVNRVEYSKLKLGKFWYKGKKEKQDINKKFKKLLKDKLNITSKGNKVWSCTKPSRTYEECLKYVCKENRYVIGGEERFLKYYKLDLLDKDLKKAQRRDKYNKEKNLKEMIKRLYIEKYRQKHKLTDIDIWGKLEDYVKCENKISTLSLDKKLALESILEVFSKTQGVTLRKTNAETYYQVILRIHPHEYINEMEQSLKKWLD